jgi:exonuclease SbcD
MKTVSVLLTDTHLKKDNLDLVEDIFVQACELCVEENCKTITHAGDWFTNRIGQNLQTLLRMKKIFNIVDSYGLEIVGIPGNHDKTDQDSESSYLDVFSDYKSFNLIRDKGFVIKGDVFIGFLPYFTSSYSKRLDELEKISRSKDKAVNILITHKSFNGVRNNDGSIVEDGIPTKRMKYWDKVLVGHYHDSSIIGKNIHYVGSAYQANYGEDISDKGFTLIKSDGSLEFVPSKFKKYIKVKLDASDISSIENELEFHKGTDDNVRFIFQGTKTDIEKINLSKFTDEGIDCKFESEEINGEILKVEEGDFEQMDSKKITKHFLEYCKIQGISSDNRKQGLKYLKL